MPKHGSGIRWTQERRAEHAKATIAGRKRKRRVTPRALKHFSESGIVAEEASPDRQAAHDAVFAACSMT